MSDKKQLQGQATAEQIGQWKQQYGEVYEMQVEDKVCYLKPIDRKVLKMIVSIGQNSIEIAEQILLNCWLSGDEEIRTNDTYFLASIAPLNDMLNTKNATLKKK